MSESRLLDAIRAAPDDDHPRQVYADWLAEQGRARESEHIHAALAIHRDPADHEARLAAYRTLPDLDASGDFPFEVAVKLTWDRGVARAADLRWGPACEGDWEQVLSALARWAPALQVLSFDGPLPPRLPPTITDLRVAMRGVDPPVDQLRGLVGSVELTALDLMDIASLAQYGREGAPYSLDAGLIPGSLRSLKLKGRRWRGVHRLDLPLLEVLHAPRVPRNPGPLKRLFATDETPSQGEIDSVAETLESLSLRNGFFQDWESLVLPARLRGLHVHGRETVDEPFSRMVRRCPGLRQLGLYNVLSDHASCWARVLELPLQELSVWGLAGSPRRLAEALGAASRGPRSLRITMGDHARAPSEEELEAICRPDLRSLDLRNLGPWSRSIQRGLSGADQLVALGLDHLPDEQQQPSLPRLQQLELGDDSATPDAARFAGTRHLKGGGSEALEALPLERLWLRAADHPDRSRLRQLRARHPEVVIDELPVTRHHAVLEWWTPPLESLD